MFDDGKSKPQRFGDETLPRRLALYAFEAIQSVKFQREHLAGQLSLCSFTLPTR